MQGRTYQIGKAWGFVHDLPPGPQGQRRQKKRSGFRTRKLANEAMGESLGLARAGVEEPTKQRVSQYLEGWLAGVRVSRAASTANNYSNAIAYWVLPRIGGIQLDKLTANDIRKLEADLLSGGGRNGQPLSPRSVQLVHRILHRAFFDAINDGAMRSNPVAAVARPKAMKADMHTWSRDEVRSFFKAVAGDRLEALWKLELSTGLRRGEVAGLRWTDLNGSRLSIRRQRTTRGYEVIEGTPKGDKPRLVELDADVVEALRVHRKLQLEERLFMGPAWHDTDYMFTHANGDPFHPQSLRLMLGKTAKRAGLPDLTFHELRHTAATMLLQAGVHPKVVQERLGHESIEITLDLYSHIMPSMQADAAETLRQYMNGDA